MELLGDTSDTSDTCRQRAIQLFRCTVPLWRQVHSTAIWHTMPCPTQSVGTRDPCLISVQKPALQRTAHQTFTTSYFYPVPVFPACLSFANPVGSARSCPLVQQRAVPVPAIFNLPASLAPLRSPSSVIACHSIYLPLVFVPTRRTGESNLQTPLVNSRSLGQISFGRFLGWRQGLLLDTYIEQVVPAARAVLIVRFLLA